MHFTSCGVLILLSCCVIREKTKDIIANPRELNQAVTFLHENGRCCLFVCVQRMCLSVCFEDLS